MNDTSKKAIAAAFDATTPATWLIPISDALLVSVAEKRAEQADVLRNISVPCLMIDGEKGGSLEK